MKKLRIMTVVGTRPEIIRLSRVMSCLDIYCDQIIVHTGQNYDHELNQIFFENLGLRQPDHFINAAVNNVSDTIANIISGVDKLLETNQPDAFLILGDTNSCLSAIAAKRKKVPIFHMEAGNRCYDQRVPEETNRKIVDHISDINLTYSDIARHNLLREGLPSDQIIKIGSPMNEVLHYYDNLIQESDVLEKLNLTKGDYFTVSIHREENVDTDANIKKVVNILNLVSAKYELPVILSLHPRTRKRLSAVGAVLHPNIISLKPQSFSDYICLQKHAKVVLSDSGTITEESSILNFPALNLREAHERLEGMDEAVVIMVGLNETRIIQGLEILLNKQRDGKLVSRHVYDYTAPNVSQKVLKIIVSYVDYIKRVVWKIY